MKNYFNCEERTRHIILLAMQEVAKDFQKSEAITPKERQMLAKVEEWTTKFNSSVFSRFGDSYARKIEKTMQANTLRLVGKYNTNVNTISHIAAEDLNKCVEELRAVNCLECDKAQWNDCATYNVCISCDIKGDAEAKGCPFKQSIGEVEDDEI